MMEKEIFCGEIKENPVESLKCLLNELCIPLLRAQKDWGSCSQKSVTHFLSSLEKYVAAIEEAAVINNSEKQHLTILKRPQNIISADLLQQRSMTLDSKIVSENEALLSEWIKTIEQVLVETVDERFLDISTTPLTELQHWHQRQKMLGFITEQLRGKECKSVIGVIISAKSRLLKRWKAVDIGITEATNATKDRVKYLEALHRHLEALSSDTDPVNLVNSTIPTFFSGIQQIENMTKFFSKNGYLGLLLTKVSNQLTQNCKLFLKESLTAGGSEDRLWNVIRNHMASNKAESASTGGGEEKNKDKAAILKSNSSFYERIQACIAVRNCFQEELHRLRDWLFGAHGLHRYSSLSSVSTAPGRLSSLQTTKTNKTSLKMPPSLTSSTDQQQEYQNSGVAITDDDIIMYHLEALSTKLKQTLDIMEKLQEYKILSSMTEGLRKPVQEDLIEDDNSESGSICGTTNEEIKGTDFQTEAIPHQHQMLRQTASSPGKLHTLVEEDEAQMNIDDSSMLTVPSVRHGDSPYTAPSDLKIDEPSADEEDTEMMLSNEEKHMLANLYNREDMDDDDCTLSSVLMEKLEQMIELLAQYIDADILLDTERRDHNPFEEGYSEFLVLNQQTEKYISVYIQALFLRRITCKDALSILQRFSSVKHRQGIQHIINECYVEVFDWFYDELKEVQQLYETFKPADFFVVVQRLVYADTSIDSISDAWVTVQTSSYASFGLMVFNKLFELQAEEPVLSRNMPPAVGAITWSRKLMSRIENTMKAFKNVRIVASCLTYSHTVKLYNRLASALLSYEDLWYLKWKSQVDRGLSGLNFTLLVRDPATQQLRVNTDMRIIHLIEETKWMLRLGISVPEAALQAHQQADKFKMYKSNLQDVVEEYERIQRKIPKNLAVLFASHLERVKHQFQPGLSTLSWSSVNIEGLLHQTSTTVKRLQCIVDKVTEIKEQVIESTLKEISCFDLVPVEKITDVPKNPVEFVQFMELILVERKAKLEAMASTIRNAFEDILKSLKSFQESTKENNRPSACSRSTASNSRMKRTTCKPQTVSLSSDNSIVDYPEEITSQVLESLSEQLYQAVFTCILHSLVILAQLIGCDMESFTTELLGSGQKSDGFNHQEKKPLLDTSNLLLGPKIQEQRLRFKLSLIFKIPHILINPPMDVAQDAIKQVVLSIINISDSLSWWSGERKGQAFKVSIAAHNKLQHIVTKVETTMRDIHPVVKKHVFSLSCYDFLWSDNMYKQSEEFLNANPGLAIIHKEVKRLLDIEEKIKGYPEVLELGCICLDYSLLKDTLNGFAGSWKSHYATILHQRVKDDLHRVVQYRETVWQQLTTPVESLEQLNSILTLLEDLQDMENKIDEVYRPIEVMYEHLRSYKLRIPREEVNDVANLRHKWLELMDLTSVVKETLLKEKQDIFKQELDKQVKSFIVEVIQFRNRFDTQGPAAPGVKPEEAVTRLHDFNEKYQIFDAKRKTLNSVQRLFNIVPKTFRELDRTGKDLQLLGTLYILFQKFIGFDQRFRNTLWAEVDLTISNQEIEEYWSECQIWNDKLKDWDAYIEMAHEIKFYEDIFPLLHEFKSKEIRNRHWLQVMSVTGSSFPLEANVFKVSHLLDTGLLKFKDQLISIAKAAKKEMDLEIKMRKVEEEWSEQVLSFKPYKNKVVLVKEDSMLLLEELEDAQVLLAQMLTSKEIDPLREEATTWAEKLKNVGEVLELWIEVQELWQHLEEIYNNPTIIQELPQDARRFAKVNRRWSLMMISAYKTKNVLQCCCTGDVPKEVLLRHFYQELEICFSSLNSYLGRMRQAFSRFYFLSDLALVSVLSRPCDIKYLQHHLRSLFGGIASIEVEEVEEEESVSSEEEAAEEPGPILDFLSVPIASSLGAWLSKLHSNVRTSLNNRIFKVIEDINQGVAIDEWAQKYPTQVVVLGLLYLWTRDFETSVSEFRQDRKAQSRLFKKYSTLALKLSTIASRGHWKNMEEPVSQAQRLKLENIIMILQQRNGVALQGDHGVGKTETVKDGCWSCFDDFHLLPEQAVSVFMHNARALYDSFNARLSKITIQDGCKVEAHPNCGLFLTVSKTGFQNLPNDVQAIFRAVSLVVPNHTALLKAKLTSLGFKGSKIIATRLQLISDLLKEQLSEEYHRHISFQSMVEVIYRACQRREIEKMINGRMELEGGRLSRSSSAMSYQQLTAYASSPVPSLKTGNSTDRNKKVISSNPVLLAMKESHALVADALQDVLGPRMTGDSHLVFKQILGDVFMGMYDTSGSRQILQKELEKAILMKADENKLFSHSPWLNKVKQLFSLSLVNSGVIVAGPPASGKSSCISTLIQALNHIQVSSEKPSHKIVKINPLSVDNRTLMFGGQNASHMWQDGVVTYVWKKAIRNHCNTWLWFDGHLTCSWADNFNSVLGPEKGILYIEGDALGWRPLSKIWLDGRNQQENAVLSKAFYRTLDPVFNLILYDTKPVVPVTEVGLFCSCTNLLTVMLNDKAQSIGGQLHIERLFVFCLIWSVGTLIETSERKRFSELLKVYTSVLPDDEQEISVFDYYLDESGEWDTWQSRLPDITYVGNTDIMGEVFVETQDTIIVRTFLEYASMGSQHVLLTGPQGCGKTALMNDFISTRDRARTLLKRMVFSGSSKAKELQELLEQNIVHRQGFIYGARDGKTLHLFIDDLNLPTPDENEVQSCNELLRMILDNKVLVRLNKPFEWQTLEGLLVRAVMAVPQYANNTQRMAAQRLLRHFSIFYLRDIEGSHLQQVIFSILEANMGDKDGLTLQEDLQLSLVNASCHLLESVKKVLVPSPTPGRQYYRFSLREITKVFQSLRRLSSEDREDRSTVAAYWQHEVHRVIRDRLCRHADINWFDSEMTQKIKEVLLQSLAKLDDVQSFLKTTLQHYNEELGHQKLHLELSENSVLQIIRIHRVLSSEKGGNALLVGCIGSHLSTLVKLALYVADIPLHVVDTSGHNNFVSSLKSAIQISAVEGKPTAILLTQPMRARGQREAQSGGWGSAAEVEEAGAPVAVVVEEARALWQR
ncbi:PREDICTED: dynein gamma chain, flagellar outer arm-like [Nanorana parkeri]|uniref:dynein gamma chain, flagellar outer arm-like n=1 Tax=Nanorana parkeri TaxID=125878 RepID=UPI0008545F4B|nr:PREDICTED: dynein gamma chain, flagellar outer arm-like [Nanorana parkeri]